MTSTNHSGTLDQGHYWATVKYLSSGDWLSCNDKVVLTPKKSLQKERKFAGHPFFEPLLVVIKNP